MHHFSSRIGLSNVIPFRGKTVSPGFYIADESAQEDLFPFSKGHPICSILSEEDLITSLARSKPAFILIPANLSWADPIELIARLSQFSRAPIVLLLKKTKSRKQEFVIRQAYQAGVFDIAHLPLHESDFNEMVDLVVRISKKVSGC